MSQNNYSVICGNIGTVHDGHNRAEATKIFNAYVRLSKKNVGRAAGEDVTLWENDEPVKDFYGERSVAEAKEQDA